MTPLHTVPTTSREDRIDALVRHLTDNPAAIRELVTQVVDDTADLAAASAEIVRLRGLLGMEVPR